MATDNPLNPPPLNITASALAAIRAVLEGESVPAHFCLRVGVRDGGPACANVSYLLGFDQKREHDLEYEVDGLRVLIDRKHSMYVLGMEIDWYEDETQRGFVFNNPSQKTNLRP